MSDKRFLLVVMIAVVVISAIPFVFGIIATPAGFTYSGRHAQNTGDYGVYFSQMQQAREGNFLFYNSFTYTPHARIIFNPYWLTAGWVAEALNSVPVAFHLIRLITIPLLVLTMWYAVCYFITDHHVRRFALLAALFLGGVFGYAITTDGSIFLQTLFSPHLVASAILLIASIVWMAKSIEQKKLRLAFYSSGAAFVLFWFHPYHLATIGWIVLALCVVALIRKKMSVTSAIKRLAILSLAAIGPTVYYWWMFRNLSFGQVWINQSDALMKVRTPWEIPWAFLPLFLLALAGLWRMIALKRPRAETLAIWFIVPLVAVCVPVFFRMRMTGAWFVPLILLAIEGLVWMLERVRSLRWQEALYVCTALVMCWSLVINAKIYFESMAIYEQSVPLASIPNNMVNAFEWIKSHTAPDDVTLASWYVSGIMPGFTGRPVVGGHGVQTPYDIEIQKAILDFYAGRVTNNHDFLRSFRVRYVLHSPYEKSLGVAGNWLDDVAPVFTEGDVTVYEVK